MPNADTLADGDELLADGSTTKRIAYGELKTQLASEFVAAPGTFKLAPLDGSNKVPNSYLPTSVLGSMVYKGQLAGASVPATSTAAGDYYVIISAGTSQSVTWAVGDLAVYKGTSGQWDKFSPGVTQVGAGGTGATTAAQARANLGAAWTDDVVGQTAPRMPRGGIWFEDNATYKLNGSNPVNLGLGDFTVAFIVTLPDYTPSNIANIFYTHSAGNNRAYVQLATNGDWGIWFIDNAGTPVGYALTPDVALVDGRTYLVVITCDRDANATLYVNGVSDRDANGSGVSVSMATSASIDVGSGNANPWTGQSRTVGTTQAFRLWNRLLTAADVLAMARSGLLDSAGQYGSLTRYASNFSAGLDGWAAVSGETVTGDVDAVGGENDTLRIQSGAGTRATAARALGRTIRPGQRIKFTARVYRPAGNSTGTHFQLRGGSDVTLGITQTSIPADTWTTVTIDTVSAASSSVSSAQACLVTSGGSVTVTAGDQMYIKDVAIEFPGCVMDLVCDVGCGTFVPDRANNDLHGILNTTGFTHAVPRDSGDLVIRRRLSHSDISATSGTTKILDLPPNVGILDIEIDRETACDASTTLDLGTSGTPAKHASAINLATTGKVLADSLSKVGESSTAFTSIYLKKNQATTVGTIVVRIRLAIRGL